MTEPPPPAPTQPQTQLPAWEIWKFAALDAEQVLGDLYAHYARSQRQGQPSRKAAQRDCAAADAALREWERVAKHLRWIRSRAYAAAFGRELVEE